MSAHGRPNRSFALIESMIVIHGCVARIHLMRAFDIGGAQATRVFAAYREAHPGTIELDGSEKLYKATPVFQPHALAAFKVPANRFLEAAEVLAGEPIVQKRVVVR